MLDVRGVSKRFGGLVAVDNVTLSVPAGEMHCIIGPNGAGKSTLLGLLTGVSRPTSGEVWLGDVRIDGLPSYRVARLGVARKFQVPAFFPDLSVRDNLAIAANGHTRLPSLFRRSNSALASVQQTLDQIELADFAHVPAGELSHGGVQWLEIGMVLINRPSVLLLDEPTAGMTPAETSNTVRLLNEIAAATQTTMVIVEHDMDFVRRVGHRVTVLHKGAVLRQGAIEDIERDEEVRRVYLGGEATDRVDGEREQRHDP